MEVYLLFLLLLLVQNYMFLILHQHVMICIILVKRKWPHHLVLIIQIVNKNCIERV
ncbi:hypothetical protein RIR_e3014_A0A2I1END3_9GLOM [Rhizophagus irregularis DAOM 181602=DAOM 197198]|nr:hypothetical protein RhiirB3_214801 [Rhizophagus irregularis]GET63137.1 hypothetical protein RIR_e3014_A0A2I1END3_9GLOM [Rhizophagus irregularis DAOM 181602=DAOM 197198]